MKRSAILDVLGAGFYRASFQTQSALVPRLRPSSGALLPTNCRCRKRRLGSTTSVPVARAFQDFNKFRREAAGQRRRIQVWLAAAAVLLFAFGGLLWVRVGPCRTHPMLLCWTFATGQWLAGKTHLRLARHLWRFLEPLSDLVLDLPIGSKEGAYDVGLLAETGDQILRAMGTAQLHDHITNLRVDVDLSNVRPGAYSLGVRQPGLEWTRYPYPGVLDPLTPRSGEQKTSHFHYFWIARDWGTIPQSGCR